MKTFVLWIYGLLYQHSKLIYKKLKITEADLYDVRYWSDYKKYKENTMEYEKTGCLTIILTFIPIIIIVAVLTMWTDRTLDFWCTYLGDHSANVPMWLSFLVTIIGNGVTFVINIISEIVRFVMEI